jgi:2-polyprenyl-6-methoxyphenol hydroxylase-like FAD-dependent oxidoreductase
MLKPMDVAVLGAGPAGMASALYLNRLGHRVVVFERFETARPIGSGLMLQPTGQAVLADLGLLPAVVSLGQQIQRLDGRDALSGRVVLDVRYNALRHGHAIGVHRAALFSVLHDAVIDAGIAVSLGAEVVTIAAMAAGRSKLILTSGRTEGPFDLVVDGTGAGTPLRAAARGPGRPRMMRFGALWATVPWTDAGFDRRALMQRYRRASVMIGVLPIGRQAGSGADLAAFFWSLPVDSHAALRARGFDAWQKEVVGLWPATAPLVEGLADFDDLTLARYTHATMRVPAGEGLVFVGDSAHSTSPQLGQGANMALLDAKVLALALETAPDVASALARYVALRRAHVRLYQALSLLLTPPYQSDSVALPVLRDVLVAYFGRVPPMPHLLARMVAGSLIDATRKLELKGPALLSESTGRREL